MLEIQTPVSPSAETEKIALGEQQLPVVEEEMEFVMPVRQKSSSHSRHNSHKFSFKNQQIANTPYHLLKDYPEQRVIKFEDYNRRDIENIKTLVDFDLQVPRGDFTKNYCSQAPSDERFSMEDNFDKSTFLSKMKRVKGTRNFQSYS